VGLFTLARTGLIQGSATCDMFTPRRPFAIGARASAPPHKALRSRRSVALAGRDPRKGRLQSGTGSWEERPRGDANGDKVTRVGGPADQRLKIGERHPMRR
jgi:hypothetical protein